MAEQLICNEKSVAVREGTFLPTPQSPYNFTFATVAQLVEQLIRNQQVAGSSPASSSKKPYFRIFFAEYFENAGFFLAFLTIFFVLKCQIKCQTA